jgi:hypothetical protein
VKRKGQEKVAPAASAGIERKPAGLISDQAIASSTTQEPIPRRVQRTSIAPPSPPVQAPVSRSGPQRVAISYQAAVTPGAALAAVGSQTGAGNVAANVNATGRSGAIGKRSGIPGPGTGVYQAGQAAVYVGPRRVPIVVATKATAGIRGRGTDTGAGLRYGGAVPTLLKHASRLPSREGRK